jgi:proteasome lid subunit RPN8/RPN11
MRVLLAPPLRARIQELAQAAAPRECCGLLEGMRDGEIFRVTALHPARNTAVDTDRFEIAPGDHFAALRAARTTGQGIIGCYHSHPGGVAQPSAADLAGAQQDGFVWLIANAESLNAFVYCDDGFRSCATGAD